MQMHRNIAGSLIALALCGFAALGTLAQNTGAPEEHGLKVGVKAPAFTLKDQNGKEQSLADLVVKGPVALVFYRSADW